MNDKRGARRNLLVAGLLLVSSVLMTAASLAYIQFFMGLPR
jgi:hypothetical protein